MVIINLYPVATQFYGQITYYYNKVMSLYCLLATINLYVSLFKLFKLFK